MESEGENTVVKGRSARRSKIGQQNERSTNEENIGDISTDGTPSEINSVSAETDKNSITKPGQDKQLSSTPNSSTPRSV